MFDETQNPNEIDSETFYEIGFFRDYLGDQIFWNGFWDFFGAQKRNKTAK